MKKLFILACMLAFATSAFAGQAKNAPTAKYDGIIEKYDASTKTLTVKRKDKQGEFVISDASVITSSKGKADASALAVGSKVDIEFAMDGPKKMAQKVKVSGPATTTK